MANFNLYCGIISGILGIVFWIWLPKGTFKSYFLKSKASLPVSPEVLFAWGLFAVTSNIGLTSLFGHLLPKPAYEAPDALASLMNDTLGKLIVFPLVLLLVPVFEELLFRGLIFDGFKKLKSHPAFISIFGSGLLFAFCHGPGQILGAFTFALGLGQLRVQNGNLKGNFLTHACNNAFGLLVLVYHLPTLSYPITGVLIAVAIASALYAKSKARIIS